MTTKVVTDPAENIRCSYLNVFEMRTNELSGKDEYSVELLIPKGAKKTIAAIRAAEKEALEKKFSGKIPVSARKTALRDGDEPNDEGEPRAPEYAGHWFLRTKSDRAVGVVGKDPRIPMTDPLLFVSGDYVRVQINAFGYSFKGNSGVSHGLVNIQQLRKGEPLGGATRAEDVFDILDDDDDDPFSDDPLA